MGHVLAVGQLLVDVAIKPVDRLPEVDEALRVERAAWSGGGCAHNTARALARLGVETFLAAGIGDDAPARFLREEIGRDGVRPDAIVAHPTLPTTISTVLVRSCGERAFLYAPGATDGLTADLIPDALVAGAAIMVVSGVSKLRCLDLEALLARARRSGCRTVLDTDWDPDGRWLERVERSLPLVDAFVPSRAEAAAMTGRTDVADQLRALRDAGCATVAIKLGAEGSVALTADGRTVRVDPLRVENVVDTTGAGDAFVAGFVLGMLAGRDVEDCLALGNAAGGLAVQVFGAVGGIRSRDELMAAARTIRPGLR